MINQLHTNVIHILLSVFVIIVSSSAQDTIKVQATFYDFHSDRSNPEFEQPFNTKDSIVLGMVEDYLDVDGKPVVKNSYRNDFIKYWYRDWNDSAKEDYTVPNYLYYNFNENSIKESGGDLSWVTNLAHEISELSGYNGKSAIWPYETHYLNGNVDGGVVPNLELRLFLEWYADVKSDGMTINADHDTSFKNIVIEDTLNFIKDDSTGYYVFEAKEFYPLDEKGFCQNSLEWSVHDEQFLQEYNLWVSPKDSIYPADVAHNYSFTSELKIPIVISEGLTFSIKGNDDIWVFLDGKLLLDMGGMHSPIERRVILDTVSGIIPGNSYNLKIFHAERHSKTSSLLIKFGGGSVSNYSNSISFRKQTPVKMISHQKRIQLNAPYKIASVKIFNLKGIELKKYDFSGKDAGEAIFLNHNLPSGINIIKIYSLDGLVTSSRLIIK